MSDRPETSVAEAREALASVQAMRRAGARRGTAPTWLSALMALLLGVATVPVMMGPPWSLLILVLSPLCFLIVPPLRRRMGAWRREYTLSGWPPIGRIGWVWFFAVPAILLAVMVGGQGLGMNWAAWVGGAAIAASTFAYYEFARRRDRADVDRERAP